MERLVDNIYSFKDKVEECENAYLLAVQKKLKEYEHLEEQGRLVKLPCKAEDIIYVITPCCKTVEECKVITVNYINTVISRNVFYIFIKALRLSLRADGRQAITLTKTDKKFTLMIVLLKDTSLLKAKIQTVIAVMAAVQDQYQTMTMDL